MRVLYLLDDTRPGRIVSDLAKHLRRLKRMQFTAAVCTVAPHDDGTEKIQAQEVPVVTLSSPSRRGPGALVAGAGALLRLRSLLGKFRPDVLHVAGARARVLASLAATPFPDLAVVSSDARDPVNRGFARIVEGLARCMGVRPTLILDDEDASLATPESVVLGHGIDVSAARSALAFGPDVLPLDRWYVGVTVRPGATDATRRMLQAFAVFAPHRPDASLVVLASRETARLEPWVHDLGLTGRVMCIEPPVEVSSLLQRLAVLWVPGSPLPDQRWVLDAMAVGVPVVCDHRTGLAPRVREIGGALMRDEAWPDQFAEATRELSADPTLARSVADAGRKVVDASYTMAARAERLRDLYDELSRARRRTR